MCHTTCSFKDYTLTLHSFLASGVSFNTRLSKNLQAYIVNEATSNTKNQAEV